MQQKPFNPSLIQVEIEEGKSMPRSPERPWGVTIRNLTGEHLSRLVVTLITGRRDEDVGKGLVVGCDLFGRETVIPVKPASLCATIPPERLREMLTSQVVWWRTDLNLDDFGHRAEREFVLRVPLVPWFPSESCRVYAVSGERINEIPFAQARHPKLTFAEDGTAPGRVWARTPTGIVLNVQP